MNLRIKPQPLQRWLHDFYSGLARTWLPPVAELADLVAIAGARAFPVQTAGAVDLSHPLEAALHGPAFAHTRITWPSVNAWRLPDTYLVGDQGCVHLANGLQLGAQHAVWNCSTRKVRRPIRWLARHSNAPLFHLTGTNHENRAHFVLEHLPRYFAANSTGQGLPAHCLIAPGHRAWQACYVELLGLQEACLIEGSPGTLFTTELLLVPYLGGEATLPAPATLRSMAAAMQARIRLPGERTAAPVLWISRRDAPDRQLANEEALVAITRRLLGEVEVVCLTHHDFPAQLTKLAGCQWIIGAQGQGLHLPFLTTGKQVVILEQGGPNHGHGWDAVFRDLAELAGNHAVRLFSERPPVTQGTGDWEFPTARFATQLTRLRTTWAGLSQSD